MAQRRREQAARAGSEGSAPVAPVRAPGRTLSIPLDGTGAALLATGALLALVLAVGWWWPSARGVATFSDRELSRISPFLESGHRTQQDGRARFVGSVGPTWDYLGSAERRAIAEEIGSRFRAQGVESVVLMGAGRTVQVRYQDGELLEVRPKLEAPASP
jgi:hypothetical protein